MRAGACWRPETTAVGVRDVALVVRRVEIFSIPARWEDDRCPNPARTVFVRQLSGVFGIAWGEAFAITEAAMTDGGLVSFLGHWVASDHAEAWLKGSHLAVLGAVGHVVDGHAAILLQSNVGELRNALEGAVLGRLEVQGGGPVVAEVLRVCARRAC